MYLHLGLDKVITDEEIIGVFDLDNTTVQKSSRDYLSYAEKCNMVMNVCTDLPKSFVVCGNKENKTVYITQISTSTILRRTKNTHYFE